MIGPIHVLTEPVEVTDEDGNLWTVDGFDRTGRCYHRPDVTHSHHECVWPGLTAKEVGVWPEVFPTDRLNELRELFERLIPGDQQTSLL